MPMCEKPAVKNFALAEDTMPLIKLLPRIQYVNNVSNWLDWLGKMHQKNTQKRIPKVDGWRGGKSE